MRLYYGVHLLEPFHWDLALFIYTVGAGFQAETVASAPSDYQEARHQWKNDVSRPIFKWHATDTRKQGELDIMQKLSANGEEPKV